MPSPKSVKELRGFLGLSGYYRRFIQRYGNIAKLLTNVLRNDGWKWLEGEEEGFQKLKEAIYSAPNLSLSDFREDFTIEAYASDLRVGEMLVQKENRLHFLAKF
ncbi:hypothetical protein GQ457_13G012620 [Hibiscus cannabinus]